MRRSNFALRLQPSLLEELRKAAELEGVALNQLINVAVAEKVSALRTEEYFRERGRRADRSETLRILARAGKGNPPVAGDEPPEEWQTEAAHKSANRRSASSKRGRKSEDEVPRGAGSLPVSRGLVGRSPEMRRLYQLINRIADGAHTVLILGERGAGKETIARSIHFSSALRDKPFVRVNCDSIVPEMIEERLFGHVKGASGGATQSDGLLALAGGGTVLLSAVEQLPARLQEELLRSMQEGEIRPIGGTARVPLTARILAATGAHLEQAVVEGTFRRDLYFRLNVLSLRVPPLRERREDIPLLVAHFMERARHRYGPGKEVADEALSAMLAYDWPGNLQELESCVEFAYRSVKGPIIHLEDLPQVMVDVGKMQKALGVLNMLPIVEQERLIILKALAEVNGDRLTAARMLGGDTPTLYRKLTAKTDTPLD